MITLTIKILAGLILKEFHSLDDSFLSDEKRIELIQTAKEIGLLELAEEMENDMNFELNKK